MSRETDSSSSGTGDRSQGGTQGRGAAAYPSGTPPYGTRPFPSLHPQERPRDGEPVPEAPADEPKTETTLTTRVRINIPGSRPIPPVVVRTTVDGSDTGSTELPDGWTVGGEPAPAAPAARAGQAAPQAPAMPAAPAPAPAAAQPDKPAPSDWFAPRKSGPPAPAASAPAETTQQMQMPVQPQAQAQAQAPAPRRAQAPAPAPDGADATQPLSLADIAAAGPSTPQSTPQPPPQGRRPNIPYLNEGPGGAPAGPGPRTQRANRPFPDAPGAPGGPAGPVGFGGPGGPGSPGAPGGTPFPSYQPPAGPTSGPMTGEMRAAPAPAPAPASAPSPSPFSAGPAERFSGETLVSGIPAAPFVPSPVTKPVPAAAKRQEPAAKGRSKVILTGVALVTVAGIAYGVGLLMDHADVPAGTTVLGVSIGGKSKADAVAELEAKLGKRETDPLTVTIGDTQKKLTPSSAGLDVDLDATVADVAHRDYNPVTVIGSLFGGTRVATAELVIDDEKLTARLGTLSDELGSGSTATEGMVKFTDGKAVAVPGKARTGINVSASVAKVKDAYRTRLETGVNAAVPLSVTTVQPKVTQAELDAAVNGFGKTAMSGIVTVNAGSGHVLLLGDLSLPKILTMTADDSGNLQPHFDLAALKTVMSATFDGVLLERGDGSKTEVTPQDVASAILPALKTTDESKKTVTFPNIA